MNESLLRQNESENQDLDLSCHIHSEWPISETVDFLSFLDEGFTDSKDGLQTIEVQAFIGGTNYRLDVIDQSADNENVSLIYSLEGGVIWLDHKRDGYAKIDYQKMPPKIAKRTLLEFAAPAVAQGADRERILANRRDLELRDNHIIETIIRDSYTHRSWIHYFICDPMLQASPDILQMLLTILIGDRELQLMAGFPWDNLYKAVSQTGLPIAGGMIPIDEESGKSSGTMFRIDNIQYLSIPNNLLEIPEYYLPLNELDPDNNIEGDRFALLDRNRERITFHANDRLEEFQRPGFDQPTVPHPAGQTSVIGLWIPQTLLDGIKQGVNQAMVPLSSFTLLNGFFTIDWLEQFRNHWLGNNGGAGNTLYCLLHDEPLPAQGAAVPAKCDTFTGLGLLDSLAVKDAKGFVNSSGLPASITSALPTSVTSELTSIGPNWMMLSASSRARIACEVLWQLNGRIDIPINKPQPNAPINFEICTGRPNEEQTKIMDIELSNMSGTLTLPNVERSTSTPPIESRPLLKNLYCRYDGYIVAEISPGEIAVDGSIKVTLSPEVWAGLAIANIASFLFPPLAGISTHAAIIGLELLSRHHLRLRVVPLSIFCYLSFRQNAAGIFGPNVEFSVDGDLEVQGIQFAAEFASVNLLRLALRSWISDNLLRFLGEKVSQEVNKRLQELFEAGFPAAVGDLGIPITRGSLIGVQNDHVYIEAELGIIPGVSPPRRTITVNPHMALGLDVNAFRNNPNSLRQKEGLHLLSLNLSENAINDILAARRFRGIEPPLSYSGPIITTQQLSVLASLAQQPAQPSHFGFVMLESISPPNIMLLPGNNPNQYAALIVDFRLMSLALDPFSAGLAPIPAITWTFRVSSAAQVVLGSAQPEPGTSASTIIDLQRFRAHLFDILIDINNCNLQLLSLSETFSTGASQAYMVTPLIASQQEPLIRSALKLFSNLYDFHREPRRDGIGASTMGSRVDLPREQTYSADGSDPDAGGSSPVIEFPTALGLNPGLFHIHLQLAGLLTPIFDGLLSLGAPSSNCNLGHLFQSTFQNARRAAGGDPDPLA